MCHLKSLSLISALVLLSSCGGISTKEKSQASIASGTRTSVSTSSAVTTETATSMQLGSVSIDASGVANVSAGSKLLVTIKSVNQNVADQRVLVFDLPAIAHLTVPNLAAKPYKLSLQIVDQTGKVIITTESAEISVTAGAATALKATMTVGTPATMLKVEPAPVNPPQVEPNPTLLQARAALRAEIKDMIADLTCVDDSDCKLFAMGQKACGGPEQIGHYSKKTVNEVALANKLREYNRIVREIQEIEGGASTCDVEMSREPRCLRGANSQSHCTITDNAPWATESEAKWLSL